MDNKIFAYNFLAQQYPPYTVTGGITGWIGSNLLKKNDKDAKKYF